jgi:hypothetical protein
MLDFEDRICPHYFGTVPRKSIRLFNFDCPHCFKTLRPAFFPGYARVRYVVCVASGWALAWRHGFTDSFVVFVIGFYALPAFRLWDWIVSKFFLPKVLEPAASSYVQVLGLSSGFSQR